MVSARQKNMKTSMVTVYHALIQNSRTIAALQLRYAETVIIHIHNIVPERALVMVVLRRGFEKICEITAIANG
jgi:hypothetical protein